MGLLAVAAVVQASVGAAIGSSTLAISGYLETASIGREAVAWWLGDVSGSLLIAPVLLGATGRKRLEPSRQARVEALATWTGLAVCMAVAVWFTFCAGRLAVSCNNRLFAASGHRRRSIWPARRGSGEPFHF